MGNINKALRDCETKMNIKKLKVMSILPFCVTLKQYTDIHVAAQLTEQVKQFR